MAGRPDPIRILVVDGSESFLVGLRTWVSGEPTLRIVAAATTGDEALEAVDRHRPELVLLDAILPGVHGFDVTREIKTRPGSPAVVVLTFHDSRAVREEAWAAGADGFVAKPRVAEELMPLIRRLFPGRDGGNDGGRPGAGRAGTRPAPRTPSTPAREDGAVERRGSHRPLSRAIPGAVCLAGLLAVTVSASATGPDWFADTAPIPV